MKQKPRKKYLAIFTLIISMLLSISISYSILIAQSNDSATETTAESEDLSQVNWDEEDTAESEDLSQVNWDEEDTEEGGEAILSEMNFDEEGESSDEDSYEQDEEIKAEEYREKKTLILGFLFFSFYILGGIYTVYFTRDRKLAVHYPPELLILLHTLWPVEWLFLVFAGKKVR